MKSFVRTCLLLSSLSPLAAHSALAQSIPSSAETGRTSNTLRSIEQRPEVTTQPLVTVDEKQRANTPLQTGVSFMLRDVHLENNTAFTVEELKEVYGSYIGQKSNLSTLNEIAAKLTARFRNAGYILTRVVVAPQRIQGGEVVMRVIEGSVDQVTFQGEDGADVMLNSACKNSALLNEYAEKIRASKPLNAAVLERYLLLMEDLPGVSARATLTPSRTQTGASNVVITLSEKPVNIDLTADNRGTRYLGQGQVSATVALNNMLGCVYEKTQLRVLNSAGTRDDFKELHYGELRHEQQLDSEGTKLALAGAYTRSDLGHTQKANNTIGDDMLLSAEVSHPFIRSRESNLYGNVEYNHRKTQVETLGVDFYEDRLNVVRAGGSYDFVDQLSGVNRVEGKISKGFGWDDDSPTGRRSRLAGQTNFEKVSGEVSRLQPLMDSVGLLVAATGQAADTSLLSSEQFGVGGANYGSAYDPSEITGDSGAAARAELQYTRSGDIDFIPTYQLYSFYDLGRVWTRRPGAGTKADESLADAGVGVRFNTTEKVTGGLEFGVPLTHDVSANGTDPRGPRVFFNLGYRYQ